MIKIRRVGTLIVAGLLCLTFFRPVSGQEMSAEELAAAIAQKFSGLQDLQADMTVGMQMFGQMTEMKGTVWQKGKLLRAEMTLPPELMPKGDKVAEPVKILMVFDGETMWQSLPMMKMVTRINISELEGTMKNLPFSGSFNSLPNVSYQLSEREKNGIAYYFLETRDAGKFMQNSPVSGMGVNLPTNMSFERVGVWINKDTLFPKLIELYAQDDAPALSVEFSNVKIDQGLSPQLFTFKVPEGVPVMDLTASVKAVAEKAGK